MAITRQDCAEVRKELETVGGDTYHIRRIGETDFQKMCFRPILRHRQKVYDDQNRLLRCSYQAGRNTDHLGTGSCSLHGGGGKNTTNGVHFMKHGRNNGKIRGSMRGRIDEYYAMSKTELRDLTKELATVKAIFSEMVDNIPEIDDEDFPVSLSRIQNMVGTIGRLVDRISTIESRDTLTVAQVLYFRTVVADILMTYITDPRQRELAAKDLVQRIGGTEEYARVLPGAE